MLTNLVHVCEQLGKRLRPLPPPLLPVAMIFGLMNVRLTRVLSPHRISADDS